MRDGVFADCCGGDYWRDGRSNPWAVGRAGLGVWFGGRRSDGGKYHKVLVMEVGNTVILVAVLLVFLGIWLNEGKRNG